MLVGSVTLQTHLSEGGDVPRMPAMQPARRGLPPERYCWPAAAKTPVPGIALSRAAIMNCFQQARLWVQQHGCLCLPAAPSSVPAHQDLGDAALVLGQHCHCPGWTAPEGPSILIINRPCPAGPHE
jgi:hypothetical protein